MRAFILSLLLLLLPAIPAFAATQNAPQDVPALLQMAIDEQDADAALKHMDIEAVINNIVTTQLPQINAAVLQGNIRLNQALVTALAALNSGNAATRRTVVIFLSAEMSKFITFGVNSGAFAGTPISENERMSMDTGVFGQLGTISIQRKEFSGTKLLSLDGNKALISTNLRDFGAKKIYPLELQLQKSDNVWKVTSIHNIEALLASAN